MGRTFISEFRFARVYRNFTSESDKRDRVTRELHALIVSFNRFLRRGGQTMAIVIKIKQNKIVYFKVIGEFKFEIRVKGEENR